MLEVLAENEFKITPRANADIERLTPTLVKMNGGVLVIGGRDLRTRTFLSAVSFYSIARDSWKGGYPTLNTARYNSSACVLQAIVYVFCGAKQGGYLNTIEVISENLLFPES